MTERGLIFVSLSLMLYRDLTTINLIVCKINDFKEISLNWQDVCDNDHLQNLPFKVELNEYGQVIMSPMKVFYFILQGENIPKKNWTLTGLDTAFG